MIWYFKCSANCNDPSIMASKFYLYIKKLPAIYAFQDYLNQARIKYHNKNNYVR